MQIVIDFSTKEIYNNNLEFIQYDDKNINIQLLNDNEIISLEECKTFLSYELKSVTVNNETITKNTVLLPIIKKDFGIVSLDLSLLTKNYGCYECQIFILDKYNKMINSIIFKITVKKSLVTNSCDGQPSCNEDFLVLKQLIIEVKNIEKDFKNLNTLMIEFEEQEKTRQQNEIVRERNEIKRENQVCKIIHFEEQLKENEKERNDTFNKLIEGQTTGLNFEVNEDGHLIMKIERNDV